MDPSLNHEAEIARGNQFPTQGKKTRLGAAYSQMVIKAWIGRLHLGSTDAQGTAALW
jgi:hypothetical protein